MYSQKCLSYLKIQTVQVWHAMATTNRWDMFKLQSVKARRVLKDFAGLFFLTKLALGNVPIRTGKGNKQQSMGDICSAGCNLRGKSKVNKCTQMYAVIRKRTGRYNSSAKQTSCLQFLLAWPWQVTRWILSPTSDNHIRLLPRASTASAANTCLALELSWLFAMALH